MKTKLSSSKIKPIPLIENVLIPILENKASVALEQNPEDKGVLSQIEKIKIPVVS